ncbi:glycoprotein-N-acetylgalactosamine 3-beta-galactosyltransferase 1-like [Homalodisca vitripennis]|uniref:glycoprotein-N-acetylgalactosamine 3-beta-galactosyltransferase 1-like n=2 Tax=Homalodisca vitripennis TaxID=197043 RepID=UPI001EEAF405|nr:glycoprotein-N-acetylgalactosamine 3-beta-galactosyltransferase 1-like [Homalodisca vitripennis]
MAIYPSKISVFFLGFAIGVIAAFILTVSMSKFETHKPSLLIENAVNIKEDKSYDQWLTKTGYRKFPINFDHYSYSRNKSLNQLRENQLLKAKVNVLCVMFITNVNNAYAAMETWMKQCNSFKFYGTKPEKYLEITVMRPKNSWHYLCEVLRHLDNNSNDYMWVLFVPDDVFAIPENLRHYVFGLNYNDPYYFGHSAFFWNEYYNIAQAGYVLSKGSIKTLITRFSTSESCIASGKYWKNEDYYLGKYLAELGVLPTDTRDKLGRGRFHLYTISQLVVPGDIEFLSKYWKSSIYPVKQGNDCCHPLSITFRGTSKATVYFHHYLLYNVHLHIEAGRLGNVKSDTFTPSDEIWQQFVLDELGPNVNLSSITPKKFYNLWVDKLDSPSIFNKKLRALFGGDSDD